MIFIKKRIVYLDNTCLNYILNSQKIEKFSRTYPQIHNIQSSKEIIHHLFLASISSHRKNVSSRSPLDLLLVSSKRDNVLRLSPPRGPAPFYSTPHRSSKQCFAARKEISRGTVHGLGVAFSSLETNSLGLSIRKPTAYVFGKNNSWGTSKPWSCEINCRVKRKKERKKLGF